MLKNEKVGTNSTTQKTIKSLAKVLILISIQGTYTKLDSWLKVVDSPAYSSNCHLTLEVLERRVSSHWQKPE